MDKLGDGFQFRVAGKPLLDEILNGLDVVVGGGLNGFDTLRIGLAEVLGDSVKLRIRLR